MRVCRSCFATHSHVLIDQQVRITLTSSARGGPASKQPFKNNRSKIAVVNGMVARDERDARLSVRLDEDEPIHEIAVCERFYAVGGSAVDRSWRGGRGAMRFTNEPAAEPSPENASLSVAEAAALLSAGKVVAFPTETVYGLGADARNAAAVRDIFRLKGRPADHPLIVHLPEASQLAGWATAVPAGAWRLAEAFWPGPLTLVLQRQTSVSDVVTGGQPTVGLRVPSQPLARALLAAFEGGIAAPSANRFGRISPTTAAHVRAEFCAEVPILDGGACAVGLESTILDLSGGEPRLLRPGAITAAELEAVLGQPVASGAAQLSPRVSGSLPSHYAPQLPALLLADVSAAAQKTDAVLSRQPQRPAVTRWLTLPDEPARYGQALYAALRELDASGAARILIEAVPDTPAWAAVRDRLARATAAKPAAHHEQAHRDGIDQKVREAARG